MLLDTFIVTGRNLAFYFHGKCFVSVQRSILCAFFHGCHLFIRLSVLIRSRPRIYSNPTLVLVKIMPLDKKSIPLFLLLGCFCLSLLLTPRTNDDLAFQKSREIHDSATNIQQPENGMFAEYVQYTFENYAIVDTSWWLYQYTNVNTTHYNSSITYMHDNTTAVGHSWIVVRRSTGIIEDDYNYFGLNGTQDCMFIYNESTVSFVTGNRAVFSTPDLFQVNSTGFDPYYGSFVVAYGLTTAANEEVWYHTGSGLLIHGLQTLAPGNTSELWLTRSNMYYDMLYTPPFPSNDPWVRYDCGTWNTTSRANLQDHQGKRPPGHYRHRAPDHRCHAVSMGAHENGGGTVGSGIHCRHLVRARVHPRNACWRDYQRRKR